MISIPRGIACIGNITSDTLVRSVGEITYDTTQWVEEITQTLGGNGANTSYALARLGAPVRLLGWVGQDAFGDASLGMLASAGVDLSSVCRSSLPTATTVVLVNTEAARAFLHRPGASREAFPTPVEWTADLVETCSHVHLANLFALPRLRPHAGDMLARAKAAGLTVSMDTGWDARNEWMGVLGPCLVHTDILFVNEEESERLGVGPDGEGFLEHGVGLVVMKRGAAGCSLVSPEGTLHVPAFPVRAIDSTGAGDCFAGAFLAGLHRGLGLEQAGRIANAVGAMNVLSLGAVTGVRDWDATLAWMGGR